MENSDFKDIRPQKGFQEQFLASSADIVIGGGAAGVGKTFALLMEVLRHSGNSGFGAVIFRRTTSQVRNEGGLWDESKQLYYHLDAIPWRTTLLWQFPSGATAKFAHLQYETTVYNHLGAQICLLAFDELCSFTKKQFFFMMTRNRSICGVRPYIRATCNPDPESWVAEFIAWWIDQDTGFPIRERCGVLRYFTMDGENYVWGDTKQEVIEKCPHIFAKIPPEINPEDLVKSVTFIGGDIYDNKELLSRDPGYLGNLLSQDEATVKQMLQGNWKVSLDGMGLCNYKALGDIFTNYCDGYEEFHSGKKLRAEFFRITCDAARFGRDLAVIKMWYKRYCFKIVIFTKCTTSQQVAEIELNRKEFKIPASQVVVDQGGVGGGVVDEGGYIGFTGNGSALPSPESRDRGETTKENYADLKTQCYYRYCEEVNNNNVRYATENIYVDGVRADNVTFGRKALSVKQMIRDDLRSARRDKADLDGKKRMIDKAQQKNMLNGRSPDFGDCSMMLIYLDLYEPAVPSL